MHNHPKNFELASKESVFASHLRFLQAELEASLRQKAKLQWIKLGDDNTAFIHISINHRIRCNKVNFLHMNGEDIFDPDHIQAAFVDHFSNIFTTIPSCSSLNVHIA